MTYYKATNSNGNGSTRFKHLPWAAEPKEEIQDATLAWADRILARFSGIACGGTIGARETHERVAEAFRAAGAKNVWVKAGNDLVFTDFYVIIEGRSGVVLNLGVEIDFANESNGYRGKPRRQEWCWYKVVGRR